MKKILLIVFTVVLAVSAAFAVGCGSGASFKKPTLTDHGALVSDGGFLAETEKYVYVINGTGVSSADNSFGKPVKGSLVAVDKSTLGGEVKSEVVIPKLFVASDYTAGVKISGEYVYFGSPSTDKNSKGGIANDELAFQRAKLDGTQTKGDVFFSVSSLSAKYRITEEGGIVYIIYQDSSDSSVKVYDTSSKKTVTVAKTDEKNNDAVKSASGKDVYLSMGDVTFAEDSDSVALFYTVKVYDEEYFKDKAEKEGYSRSTASYNAVYAVNAKGEAVKVLDGEEGNVTYAITLVKDGYVFYTATPSGGEAKTYVKAVKDALNESVKAEVVKNTKYAVSGAIIESLSEVYFYDSDAKSVVKSTLVGDERAVKTNVYKADDVSSLIAVKDGYVYYNNASGEIARAEMNNEKAVAERVSAGSVNSSWYAPEFVTANGTTYLFYLDTTTTGSSYVWFTDLNANNVKGEDTDDDGENDKFWFEGEKLAGVMLAEDRANAAVSAINDIASTLDLEDEDNEFVSSVSHARKVYEALDAEAKKSVSESYVVKLENAEKAIELGRAYNELAEAVKYVSKMPAAEKAALREKLSDKYEAAKSIRQGMIDSIGKDRFVNVRDLLSNNLKAYFTKATDLFSETK